jgi:hypothetical protein
VELVGPLRLSDDGRLLSVGLTGTGVHAGVEPSVLLVDVVAGLVPLARFTGHAELASGFAYLGSEHVLACWPDGAMLVWDAVEQRTLPIRDGRCPDTKEHECPPAHSSPPMQQRVCSPPVQLNSPSATRALSPIHRRIIQNGRGCDSAPPATRCPDSVLELLMANSPKPPKWAAKSRDASICEDGERSVDQGPPEPKALGKWARNSKVGAQVNSAAELAPVGLNLSSSSLATAVAQPSEHTATVPSQPSEHTVSSQPCEHTVVVAPMETPGLGESRDASGREQSEAVRMLSANARCPSHGNVRSCPDLMRVASSSHATHGSQIRPASEERRILQPLPPKPRFPPPEFNEPGQKSIQLQAKLPCTSNEDACRRPPRRSATVLSELREREADADLIDVARSIFAACRVEGSTTDAENIPPSTVVDKSETPSENVPNGGIEEFRARVSLLCSQASYGPMHSRLGPEAAEVGALLRRVSTLIRK